MTLRNRELAALLTVGVLTAIGFATVYIALKSQISNGSLGYAVFFFGLYLVAHVVARLTVPLADPVPAADGGAPHGDRRHGDLPARPEQRVSARALGRDRRRRVRRHALLAAPRLPRARAVQVRLRGHCDLPASCRSGPRARGDDQRLAALDPFRRSPVPAERAREDRAHRLPRCVPPREARGAGAGEAEGLGAAARDLGHCDACPLRHQRPRQRAPLLRDLRRDALRRHGADRVRRRRGRALSRRLVRGRRRGRHTCATALRTGSPRGRRTRSTARSTACTTCARNARATSSCSRSTRSPRRLRRHRPGSRDLHRPDRHAR